MSRRRQYLGAAVAVASDFPSLAAGAVIPPPSLVVDNGEVVGVRFVFPVWPCKKNNAAYAHGRRIGSSRVAKHEAAIRAHVARALPPGAEPLFGSIDDCRVDLVHRVRDDAVVVTVSRVGKPHRVGRKTGRRRDVHNLIDTLCDALQGVLYADDRQLVHVSAERVCD